MSSNQSLAKATAILPKISGSLSIIGSIFIARNVFKKWRGQKSNEHLSASTRAVFNMCMADLGSSFWAHFMSTWMIPARYAYIWPYAAGNDATCTAQAFLLNFFAISGGWCNALLALTYYLTVCRQKSETELRGWKYQVLILGWPWFFGLVTALINIIVGGGGKVMDSTWSCEAWAASGAFYFTMALIGLGLLIILFSMGSLIRTVYVTEKKMDRFSQGEDSNNRAKTIQVSKQGLSYIAAYMVIFVPTIVSIITTPPKGYYIFYACIFPLQGLLTAIVYFRPKYVASRSREGEEGVSRLKTTLTILDVTVPKPFASLTDMISTRRSTSLSSAAMKSSAAPNNDGEKEDPVGV